jgi:hypothetical protein
MLHCGVEDEFDSTAELLAALIRGIAPQRPVFENSS